MSQFQVGQPAPPFEGQTWQGETLHSDQWHGKRTWLAFFRYAACPLCNLRIHQMRERFEDWSAKGLQIVAVFQSPAEQVARYVGKQEPPFPLVCDPQELLYRDFALQTSLAGFLSPATAPKLVQATKLGYLPGVPDGSKTRIPGDFLIDEQGLLADVFYGKDIGDHIGFERIAAFLR